MGIIRNLAMTPEEVSGLRPLPPGAAWMSCHFSGDGLKDLPPDLPPGFLLILDDSVPMDGQDPKQILSILARVIREKGCQGLLLDFQREGSEEAAALALLLQQALPCPVAVSELYANEAPDGPVFLPELPPHVALADYLKPWGNREVWLEIGPTPETAKVTAKGTQFSPASGPFSDCPHQCEALCCHYGIEIREDQVLFTLYRNSGDLEDLMKQAETLGVTRAVGLYQELRA